MSSPLEILKLQKNLIQIADGEDNARHRESDKKLRRAISKEKHAFFLSFNQ
ncbi:MAG: hypothetical protein K2N34_09290 [Lachnospiraceae bacterium]|nr:hypothetical protein [Lachnospiraceae bacterium]